MSPVKPGRRSETRATPRRGCTTAAVSVVPETPDAPVVDAPLIEQRWRMLGAMELPFLIGEGVGL